MFSVLQFHFYLITFSNKNFIEMTTRSHSSKKKMAIIALFFLLPALILFILWLSVGVRLGDVGRTEKIETYLDYFPAALQNMAALNIISIIFSLIAVIFSAKSFGKQLLSLRVLALITCFAAIFIMLFNIFQLTSNL
jgi:Na+/proline symporter